MDIGHNIEQALGDVVNVVNIEHIIEQALMLCGSRTTEPRLCSSLTTCAEGSRRWVLCEYRAT